MHKDIKPDIFRITSKSEIKIIDFPLAMEYMDNGAHRPMGCYGFAGTPCYGSIPSLS